MDYWIFQINPEKKLKSGNFYTPSNLKRDINIGNLYWNTYGVSYYASVNIGDTVIVKITRTKKYPKYSFSIVAVVSITKIPTKYGDSFKMKFDKKISEYLFENPIKFDEIKDCLKENVTQNKTILPISSKIKDRLLNINKVR